MNRHDVRVSEFCETFCENISLVQKLGSPVSIIGCGNFHGDQPLQMRVLSRQNLCHPTPPIETQACRAATPSPVTLNTSGPVSAPSTNSDSPVSMVCRIPEGPWRASDQSRMREKLDTASLYSTKNLPPTPRVAGHPTSHIRSICSRPQACLLGRQKSPMSSRERGEARGISK